MAGSRDPTLCQLRSVLEEDRRRTQSPLEHATGSSWCPYPGPSLSQPVPSLLADSPAPYWACYCSAWNLSPLSWKFGRLQQYESGTLCALVSLLPPQGGAGEPACRCRVSMFHVGCKAHGGRAAAGIAETLGQWCLCVACITVRSMEDQGPISPSSSSPW